VSVPLGAAALAAARHALPEWRVGNDALVRQFRFADFPTAMRFMSAAVADIEAMQHHPTWTNTYDRVEVRLCTHDAGDSVTELDVRMAHILQALAREHGAT